MSIATQGPNAIATQLTAYLAGVQQAAQPFSWQANNCCHFVAAWVALATGLQPLAGVPGVRSPYGARRVLGSLGGSLLLAWAHRLGHTGRAATLAQVGDVVLLLAPGMAPTAGTGQAVGVCCGSTAAVLGMAGEVQHVPMRFAVVSWPLAGLRASQAQAAPAQGVPA